MAANSDGTTQLVTTIVTCEGDLNDPQFNQKFDRIVKDLNKLLFQGSAEEKGIYVNKLEPWNSVRVTITVPREAATKLHQLAQQGDAALSRLGILSVQVEGDQMISLRLGSSRLGGENQELVLRTTAGPSNTNQPTTSDESAAVNTLIKAMASATSALPSPSPQLPTPQFKSPNVVAVDSTPLPPIPPSPSTAEPSPRPHIWPFVSMNQAAQTIHNRESMHTAPPPPPPYPGSQNGVYKTQRPGDANASVHSSPLLVNLLQNEGSGKMPPPMDKHKKPLITSPNVVKNQDGFSSSEFSQSAFANVATDIQVVQRLQKLPDSVTNSTQNRVDSIGSPNGPTARLVNKHNVPSQELSQTTKIIGSPNVQTSYAVRHTFLSSSPITQSRLQTVPQNVTITTNQLKLNQGYINQIRQGSSQLITKPNITQQFSQPQIVNRLQPQYSSAGSHKTIQTNAILQQRTDLMSAQMTAVSNHDSNLMLKSQSATNQSQNITSNNSFHSVPNNNQLTHVSQPSCTYNETSQHNFNSHIQGTNQATTTIVNKKPGLLSNENKLHQRFITTSQPSENSTQETKKCVVTSQPAKSPNLTSSGKQRQFLINPLTGDMEPMSSDSSSDSDNDEKLKHLPLADDNFYNFSSPITNDRSNSVFSDDDDTNSPTSRRNDTTTDQSDSEATVRSTNSETSSRHRSSPLPVPAEKIKLRLKLTEKKEPYKVDVSFGNSPLCKVDKRHFGSPSTSLSGSSAEGLRVPPLHISLRGRNAAVVVGSRKEKKWKDSDDETKKPTGCKVKTSINHLKTKNSNQELLKMCSKQIKIENTDEDDSRAKLKRIEEIVEPVSSSVENSETTSNYNPVLPPGRIYPTEAEVASILRSMPSDKHNKMSLSFNKVKKRESKKKCVPRERTGSVDNPNLHRIVERTHSKTKINKSSAVSLFKNVVKSSAVKEARLLAAATFGNRNNFHDKQRALNNGLDTGTQPGGSQSINQRRTSVDLPFSGSHTLNSSITKLSRPIGGQSPDTYLSSSQFSSHILSGLKVQGPNTFHKDMNKKPLTVVSRKVTNSKSKDSRNSKFESGVKRKEFQLKRNDHFIQKFDIDKPNCVTVGCVQVEKRDEHLSLPVTDIDVSEKNVKQRLLEDTVPQIRNIMRIQTPIIEDIKCERIQTESKNMNGSESPAGHGNTQGEDSGIESMDALSEKSPNQGESPCRKDDQTNGQKTTVPLKQEPKMQVTSVDQQNVVDSPELDDVQPFRRTPALYTYSNPEKIRDDSPPLSPKLDIEDILDPTEPQIVSSSGTDGDLPSVKLKKRKRLDSEDSKTDSEAPVVKKPNIENDLIGKSNMTTMNVSENKSLLEQLLIDIPPDTDPAKKSSVVSTRSTRSHRTNSRMSVPISSGSPSQPSLPSPTRRSNRNTHPPNRTCGGKSCDRSTPSKTIDKKEKTTITSPTKLDKTPLRPQSTAVTINTRAASASKQTVPVTSPLSETISAEGDKQTTRRKTRSTLPNTDPENISRRRRVSRDGK